MADAPMTTKFCSRCGTPGQCAEGGLPPGWSVAFENGRTEHLCRDCVRANVRSIEAKLPGEYWE